MARTYSTGIVITGDASSGVRAINLTREELDRLAGTQRRNRQEWDRGTQSQYRAATALQQATNELQEQADALGISGLSWKSCIGIVAGVGVAAFTAMAATQAKATQELVIMSDALGMSTEQLSEFTYVASKQGLEASQSMDLLKEIAEKLGEAVKFDSGEGKEALETLGLAAEDLIKKSPVDMLLAIGSALDQVGSEAEKSAILEMLGNDLTKLLPVLRDGASGYHELAQQGRDLNVVISDLDAQKVTSMTNAIDDLLDAGSGEVGNVLAFIAPNIEAAATAIADNMFMVTGAATTLAGIMAGRFVSDVASSVAALQAAKIATAEKAAADVAAARAAEARAVSALRVAQSEQAAAQRALANARAMTVASQAAYARTRALDALAVANARVTAAESARAAATVTAARATTVATVAANGLRGVLALFGGPWGFAAVAGIAAITAAFYMQQKQAEATANELQRVTAMADVAKAKAAEPEVMKTNLAEEEKALAGLQAKVAETERSMARIRKQLDAGGLPVATVVALSETYSTLQTAVAGADDQIRAHQSEIARLKSGLQAAGVEVEGTTGRTDEQAAAVAKLIAQLEDQERQLRKNGKEMLEYRLEQQKATSDETARALKLYEDTEALRKKKAAEAEAAEEIRRATKAYKNWLDQVRDAADPARKLSEEIEKVNAAVASGDLTEAQGQAYIKKLKDGFKESAEAGEDEFAVVANRVAQTLQNSIASGDWQGVGVAVGAVLAGEIGAAVSKEMASSLESQMGAQMAGIAGAFGGAVVGGALTYLLTSSGTELTDDSGWRQEQQGTGTVLGDLTAQTESIAKATDITAGATEDLVGINRDMLRALQDVMAGISGASTLIARDSADIQFAGFNAPESKFLGAVDSLISNSVLDVLGGGLLSSALGSLLGGSSKVTDSGIQLAGGSLADLQQSVDVDAYQDTKYKKWKYGSTRRRTDYADVDAGIEAQFAAVFASVADSAFASATAIGLAEDEVSRAIDEFNIATTQISLKGLSAEEQQAQIQAEFSKIFDGLSGEVVPFIDGFQRAGEGLGETLARIATQVQVADEAAYRLGFNAEHRTAEQFAHLSDELIKASGGIESFISGMSGFVETFAPEARKFELLTSDMTRSLADVGLAVPATRDEMWQLMQTLDAGTEAGRAQIATLLNLTDTADDYYTALDEVSRATEAAAEAERQRQQDMLSPYLQNLADWSSEELSRIESDYQERIALAEQQMRVGRELRQYVEQLKISELSPYDPGEKLQLASESFAKLLVRAESGDLDAAGQLQSAANAYLQNADSYYGRSDPYTSIFEDVSQSLDQLGLDIMGGLDGNSVEKLNAQMLQEQQRIRDYAREQLDWTVSQYDALTSIGQLIELLPEALASQLGSITGTAASASATESLILSQWDQMGGGAYSNTDLSRYVAGIDSGAVDRSAINADLAYYQQNQSAAMQQVLDLWEATGGGDYDNADLADYAARITAGEAVLSAGDLEYYRQQQIPAFAKGGDHVGGIRLVGEDGPELEVTGPSRIFNAADTRKILSAQSAPQVIVQTDPALLAEIQQLRAQVERLESEQRRANGKAEQQRSDQQRATESVARAAKTPVGVL